jgi:hypothetical protein
MVQFGLNCDIISEMAQFGLNCDIISEMAQFGLNCDIISEMAQFGAHKRNKNVKTEKAKQNLKFLGGTKNSAELTFLQL